MRRFRCVIVEIKWQVDRAVGVALGTWKTRTVGLKLADRNKRSTERSIQLVSIVRRKHAPTSTKAGKPRVS